MCVYIWAGLWSTVTHGRACGGHGSPRGEGRPHREGHRRGAGGGEDREGRRGGQGSSDMQYYSNNDDADATFSTCYCSLIPQRYTQTYMYTYIYIYGA